MMPDTMKPRDVVNWCLAQTHSFGDAGTRLSEEKPCTMAARIYQKTGSFNPNTQTSKSTSPAARAARAAVQGARPSRGMLVFTFLLCVNKFSASSPFVRFASPRPCCT